MNTSTNTRLLITKAILWFVVGTATVTGLSRLFLGLGATTALSDAIPWGLWKSFNVLACIPMAAAGFVIAGVVHCFHIHRYHAIVRATVLMAFLGYMTAVTGLVLDIGKPWNIWRPIFYWNMHSPLFEVAWCIIIYATVMIAEFAPVLGERFGWHGFVRFMKKTTPILAVLAVSISTLHQSTLGTLFTLSPERLHPLWSSPIQNVIFFVSAIGMGLCFISLLTLFSGWLYRREMPMDVLRGLTGIARWALLLYAIVRLGDLAYGGRFSFAMANDTAAWTFWVEMVLGVAVPVLLFSLPALRQRPWALVTGATAAIAGLILQRMGVGTFSQFTVVHAFYVPTVAEWSVTLGVISVLALIFMFAVENLRVWEHLPRHADHYTPTRIDPLTALYIGDNWLGGTQRGVQAWIFGVIIGLVIMEFQLPIGMSPAERPVPPVREVAIEMTAATDTVPASLSLIDTAVAPVAQNALMIGGGDERFVLFAHRQHQQRLGGEQSCGLCHHRNLPLARGTSCSHCHADLYRETNTFSHARHTAAMAETDGCAGCHPDDRTPKTRTESRACNECHVPAPNTLVAVDAEAAPGMACGYTAAMHGLCVTCHEKEDTKLNAEVPRLALCTTCHGTQAEMPAPMTIKVDDRLAVR